MPKRSKVRINGRTVSTAKRRDKAYEIRDRDLRGFLLRISPTGTKTYYAQWARGRRSRIGDAHIMTPERARKIAEQKLAAGKRGEEPEPQLRNKVPLLGKYLDVRYGPYAEQTQKAGPANVQRMRGAFPDLLSERLDQITPWQTDKWKAERKRAGTKPSTINRDLAALKAALNQAVAWDVLRENPIASIRPLAGADEKRVRYLSKPEHQRLMVVLDELPKTDNLRPLVVLSLNTGLRRGETFSLRWKDVCLGKNPSLVVEAAHAKSGVKRHIPLNVTAARSLQEWRVLHPDVKDYVFPGRWGGEIEQHKAALDASPRARRHQGFSLARPQTSFRQRTGDGRRRPQCGARITGSWFAGNDT